MSGAFGPATLATLGAAALGAAAVAVVLSSPPGAGRVPVSSGHLGPALLTGGSGRARRPNLLVTAVSAAGVVLAASWLDGTRLAATAVLAAAAVGAGRMALAVRRTKEAAARRHQAVAFAEALVGELRAGLPVSAALERSASGWPELRSVVSAARLGADVPDALRRVADRPGAGALDQLAGAWQLCAVTGGGLALAASQVLATARGDAELARQVDAELASARATARLVALLPLVILCLADGLDAHPFSFLLGRTTGVCCLAAGLTLLLLGLTWIERIALHAVTGDR